MCFTGKVPVLDKLCSDMSYIVLVALKSILMNQIYTKQSYMRISRSKYWEKNVPRNLILHFP